MLKKLITSGVAGFLCSCMTCTVPENKGSALPDQSRFEYSSDSAKASAPVDDHQDVDVIPETVGPQQWVNLSFVLLPKPVMFQRFGYEVYRCADSRKCGESDSFYVLSNNRIKYDRFFNDTLKVIAVNRKQDGEWMISFLSGRHSINLFAHTKKAALSEMVLLKDFEAASRRWIGRSIFSSKGVISSNGTNGNLSSVKVRRFDSLKVYDVRYGLTPLPVNPIWLMIKSGNGIEGFIPVRYSWSNVMTDQVHEGLPWADEILEFNPLKRYSWDAAIWELIENHRIAIGMEREQIIMSWGRPIQKSDTTLNGSKLQCWIYPAQKLYFNEIALISIEDVSGK